MELLHLNDLGVKGTRGRVLLIVDSASGPLVSSKGWKYRKLMVRDARCSIANLLISEDLFNTPLLKWSFICDVKSSGVSARDGVVTLFYEKGLALAAYELWEYASALNVAIDDLRRKLEDRADQASTHMSYRITQRECIALNRLIRAYCEGGFKPVNYKAMFGQVPDGEKMFTIPKSGGFVQTTLVLYGLIRRPQGKKVGLYEPTSEGIRFWKNESTVPAALFFTRQGRSHIPVESATSIKQISFREALNVRSKWPWAYSEVEDTVHKWGGQV